MSFRLLYLLPFLGVFKGREIRHSLYNVVLELFTGSLQNLNQSFALFCTFCPFLRFSREFGQETQQLEGRILWRRWWKSVQRVQCSNMGLSCIIPQLWKASEVMSGMINTKENRVTCVCIMS